MIKFFRKIRHKMLTDNKLSKYLLYAVGEIVLVVIGILIALNINNNNENKIIKAKEQIYLIQLKEEFTRVQITFEEQSKMNIHIYNSAKEIIELTANGIKAEDEPELSKILIATFARTVGFNTKIGLLDEIKSTGSLKDISNLELRKQLIEWDIMDSELELNLNYLHNEWYNLLDLFSKKGDIKRLWDDSGLSENFFGLSKSQNNSSNLDLINSKEFQNILLLFISFSQSTQKEWIEPTNDRIDFILELLDKEIKQG
ncbi:hypothetical protein [Robiginitalea sp. IMCC43444]|uniref:hypothetical protein n=1 Tax=Robiginitalea sp. IMCC43444 TaxID=3459121 RepID=UPI004042A1D0